MVLKITQPEPLGLQVFRALHKAILTLELTPGQSLSVQEVASQLGISRQPVREAFIKLVEAGLVTILPQRGTYVRKISVQEVMGARFNREAIETAVAKEAITKLDDSQLDQLQDLINMQVEAAQEDDWHKYLSYEDQFHKAICVQTGHERAWEVMEADKVQMDRMRYLYHSIISIQVFIAQHQAILDALKKRDPLAAEEAIKTHLSAIKNHIPIVAAKYQEFFELDYEFAEERD
jgi:DNA-binding GntR family transcriptional regulator